MEDVERYTIMKYYGIEINDVNSNSCVHNSIITQNIHSGTLVGSITNLKVDVCKNITIDDIQDNSTNSTNTENNITVFVSLLVKEEAIIKKLRLYSSLFFIEFLSSGSIVFCLLSVILYVGLINRFGKLII